MKKFTLILLLLALGFCLSAQNKVIDKSECPIYYIIHNDSLTYSIQYLESGNVYSTEIIHKFKTLQALLNYMEGKKMYFDSLTSIQIPKNEVVQVDSTKFYRNKKRN